MKCPDCQNECHPHNFRGITITECDSCRGRWFDQDELKKAKDNTDDDLRWLDFDPFGHDADNLEVKSIEKKCPGCETSMSSLTYDKSRVIIDKCNQCHGIWVQHGEFEKIINYLEDLITEKSSPEYVKDSLKQFIEIAKGSEGIISELKDFLVVTKLLEVRMGVEHPNIAEAIKRIYQSLPFI